MLYSPAAQFMEVQLLAPAWEVWPVGQLSQLQSPCALYLPAGHARQYLPPVVTPEPSLSSLVEVVKYPAPHVSQLLSPCALTLDIGHALQCVAAVDTPSPS